MWIKKVMNMKMRILGEDLKVSCGRFPDAWDCPTHTAGLSKRREAVSFLEKQKRWDILF